MGTIQVECSCGKLVQVVADERVGSKVRCPACKGLVRLPGEPNEPPGYGVEQMRRCPACKRDWPTETVVCIDCGYNFETGRKMRTKYKIPDRVVYVGVVWLGSYTRYSFFRGQRGQPCLNVSGKLLFIPLGSDRYDLSEYCAIRTDFSPGAGKNPDTYYLELERLDRTTVSIFCSANENKFKELMDLLAQVGRLEIRRK